MTTHVALLRGINVGGNKKIAMSALVGLLADLGLEGGKSLLQSGNLVFRSKEKKPAVLEKLLEAEATSRLSLETDFMVRTAEEWDKIIERNPYPDAAKDDPSHLLVVFMKQEPTKAAIEAVQKYIVGKETLTVDGRQVYCVFPEGIGRSKLANSLAKLGCGTGRNWNTLLKIAALF